MKLVNIFPQINIQILSLRDTSFDIFFCSYFFVSCLSTTSLGKITFHPFLVHMVHTYQTAPNFWIPGAGRWSREVWQFGIHSPWLQWLFQRWLCDPSQWESVLETFLVLPRKICSLHPDCKLWRSMFNTDGSHFCLPKNEANTKESSTKDNVFMTTSRPWDPAMTA